MPECHGPRCGLVDILAAASGTLPTWYSMCPLNGDYRFASCSPPNKQLEFSQVKVAGQIGSEVEVHEAVQERIPTIVNSPCSATRGIWILLLILKILNILQHYNSQATRY